MKSENDLPNQIEVALLRIDDQLYGVPLMLIAEFYPRLDIGPVFAGDPRIRGVVNVRGTTAVVLSLRACLGKQPREDDESTMIYLSAAADLCEQARLQRLQAFEEPVLLEVDAIDGIAQVDLRRIHPPPAHLNESYIEGVFDLDEGDLIYINFQELVSSLRFELTEAH